MTEERNSMGVAFVLGGVGLDPANGGLHVFKARWPVVLGGVPIVDGKPGKLRCGEWTEPRRDVRALAWFIKTIFVAAAPASAVDKNGDGVGPVARWDRSIEQKLLSIDFPVNDIANHLGIDVSRHAGRPMRLRPRGLLRV